MRRIAARHSRSDVLAARCCGARLTLSRVRSRGLAPRQQHAPKPVFERAPDALERVTWRTRTLVGDDRLTHWKLRAFRPSGLTFLESVSSAPMRRWSDLVEGSSTQQVSPQDRRSPSTHDLTADEIAAIRGRMGTMRLLTYRVDALGRRRARSGSCSRSRRRWALRPIVVPASTALAGLDTLADEFGVNVAVLADAARPVAPHEGPRGQRQAARHRHRHRAWVEEGVAPRDGARDRQGPARLPQPARSLGPRRDAPQRAARPGRGNLVGVLPRAEPPGRPAAGDDARHDRTWSTPRPICSQRSTRSRRRCSRPTASTSPRSRSRARSAGMSSARQRRDAVGRDDAEGE